MQLIHLRATAERILVYAKVLVPVRFASEYLPTSCDRPLADVQYSRIGNNVFSI